MKNQTRICDCWLNIGQCYCVNTENNAHQNGN